MTLTDAKVLLEKHHIPYHTAQYESEAAYWRHTELYPDLSQAGSCPTIALVIPAPNGMKDIELQFNRVRGEYRFEDLWFGSFCFDLFHPDPQILAADLLDRIGRIVDGKLAVIECFDLRRRRWVSDGIYDLEDKDNVFGAPGYEEAIAKAEAPKTFWQKLTARKLQYDIYDWRTCRQVIK